MRHLPAVCSVRCVSIVSLMVVCALAAAVCAAAPPAASQPAVRADAVDLDAACEALLDEQSPDYDAMYKMALRCNGQDRPDLTARLADRVLGARPGHAGARALLRAASLRLAAAQRRPASQPSGRTDSVLPAGLLGPKAINRIRLAEFMVDDMADRPRVRISSPVLDEFVQELQRSPSMTPENLERFRRSGNDDKLRWIIKVLDGRYADRIDMTSDPANIATFRQKIWPILSRSCASPACHGGPDGGSLRFILPATNGAVGMTNFYVASRCESDDGSLIDRRQPEASLLLQYGLDSQAASLKHPVPVPPIFAGKDDAKYRIVLEWIRGLRTPAPDYGITEGMWRQWPGAEPASADSAGN